MKKRKKEKKKNEINGGRDGKEDRFDSLVCVSFDPDALGRHKVVFLGGPSDVVGGRHRHASPSPLPLLSKEKKKKTPRGVTQRCVVMLLLWLLLGGLNWTVEVEEGRGPTDRQSLYDSCGYMIVV